MVFCVHLSFDTLQNFNLRQAASLLRPLVFPLTLSTRHKHPGEHLHVSSHATCVLRDSTGLPATHTAATATHAPTTHAAATATHATTTHAAATHDVSTTTPDAAHANHVVFYDAAAHNPAACDAAARDAAARDADDAPTSVTTSAASGDQRGVGGDQKESKKDGRKAANGTGPPAPDHRHQNAIDGRGLAEAEHHQSEHHQSGQANHLFGKKLHTEMCKSLRPVCSALQLTNMLKTWRRYLQQQQ